MVLKHRAKSEALAYALGSSLYDRREGNSTYYSPFILPELRGYQGGVTQLRLLWKPVCTEMSGCKTIWRKAGSKEKMKNTGLHHLVRDKCRSAAQRCSPRCWSRRSLCRGQSPERARERRSTRSRTKTRKCFRRSFRFLRSRSCSRWKWSRCRWAAETWPPVER